MNKFTVLAIMISLFFWGGGISAVMTQDVVLGEYNISFDLETNDTLNPIYQEPSRRSENAYAYTQYLGGLGTKPENLISVSIIEYDKDVTTAQMRDVGTSDDKKLWLNGLVWETKNISVPWSSLPAWMSTMVLNNKTVFSITGPFPQTKFNEILETLSIKENGKEIYKVN